MSQSYTPELKKKIVRLHEEEERTWERIKAHTCIGILTDTAPDSQEKTRILTKS